MPTILVAFAVGHVLLLADADSQCEQPDAGTQAAIGEPARGPVLLQLQASRGSSDDPVKGIHGPKDFLNSDLPTDGTNTSRNYLEEYTLSPKYGYDDTLYGPKGGVDAGGNTSNASAALAQAEAELHTKTELLSIKDKQIHMMDDRLEKQDAEIHQLQEEAAKLRAPEPAPAPALAQASMLEASIPAMEQPSRVPPDESPTVKLPVPAPGLAQASMLEQNLHALPQPAKGPLAEELKTDQRNGLEAVMRAGQEDAPARLQGSTADRATQR